MLVDRGDAPLVSNQIVMGKIEGKDVHNTSYTGFPPAELPYPDEDYALERKRALTLNTKDGVKPMTKEELDFERTLDWQLIKKFTMNIFKLDFAHFSFPAGYSEPRSFLERTADLFTFIAQEYAEKCSKATEPHERLALLSTGVLAGYYIYLQYKKPWNPVLGETYVGRWPNGVTIYGEQTSHHPAISNFQIIGPNWHCDASCKFAIDSGVFQLDVHQRGVFTMKFDDGYVYEWQFPMISVFGIIYGDRIVRVNGPFGMRDKAHNIECRIDVHPDNDRSKGIKNSRWTTIYGGVHTFGNDQYDHVLYGDYCGKVTYDNEIIFDIEKDIVSRPRGKIEKFEFLPSDSRYRLDRYYLISKNLPLADEAKIIIEEAQRREEKLRILVPEANAI